MCIRDSVVLVQLFYLLALVPVSETAFQQGEGLSVDAGMVHRGVVVSTGDGDGEETPVSADVLQLSLIHISEVRYLHQHFHYLVTVAAQQLFHCYGLGQMPAAFSLNDKKRGV